MFEDYIDLHSNDCEEAREVKDGDAYADVKLGQAAGADINPASSWIHQ